MNNIIKSINIFLAIYGLTLDCDPKEDCEFTNISIVNQDGKIVGNVKFVSGIKYHLRMSLDDYKEIKTKMEVLPIPKSNRKSYVFRFDITGVASDFYDAINGKMWVNEARREECNGFDISAHMNLSRNNKKVAFYSMNALKCAYFISIGQKELGFDKNLERGYRFILNDQITNNVEIMGPKDKSIFTNNTTYFNRKSHHSVIEAGGPDHFSFTSTAPISFKRGERAVPRIFEHVRDMEYRPCVDKFIYRMRFLTSNGLSNFFDNVASLCFNKFTALGNYQLYTDDDLEAMFAGNPKIRLGVANIDENCIVTFNTPSRVKEIQ